MYALISHNNEIYAGNYFDNYLGDVLPCKHLTTMKTWPEQELI